MPNCQRCGRTFSYLENSYCEPCAEFEEQLARESGIICEHCGKEFSEKDFERHRWRIYYLRQRAFFPKGRRRRK